MKLSQCNFGQIVRGKYGNHKYGHICGLTRSPSDKITIPIVKWDDGSEYPIHHDNLELPIDKLTGQGGM
jgi:hypothetical protein